MTALSTLKGALAFAGTVALTLSLFWPARHGETLIEALMRIV